MIRKLALLAGATFLVRKLLDRSRNPMTEDGGPRQAPPTSTHCDTSDAGASDKSIGHAPTDLFGDGHPDGSTRAEDHYRPDPTAFVHPEDRESLRPVTAPAPHDPPGR